MSVFLSPPVNHEEGGVNPTYLGFPSVWHITSTHHLICWQFSKEKQNWAWGLFILFSPPCHISWGLYWKDPFVLMLFVASSRRNLTHQPKLPARVHTHTHTHTHEGGHPRKREERLQQMKQNSKQQSSCLHPQRQEPSRNWSARPWNFGTSNESPPWACIFPA